MAQPVSPEISVLESIDEVSHEAARFVLLSAREAVLCTGRCTIALAGGNTPRRLYELMASDEYRGALPWEEIEWFWSDERCVPPTDPRSNFRMADEAMLSRVGAAPGQVHRMQGELTPARAALAYEALVRERVADQVLDLVLLGVGEDGHTASLFPGHPALEERERLVLAVQGAPTREVPERLTMTFPLINRARSVLVLAAGASKRAVVQAIRADPRSAAERFPVARLRPAGHLTWIVDQAAGG
ncbi:MAG TPA: 6-phosphogluconolactonase [Gemmatimonadales bacterium]|nr:6-phosphogluconolactonase [Gemmatimonadales bacterium]